MAAINVDGYHGETFCKQHLLRLPRTRLQVALDLCATRAVIEVEGKLAIAKCRPLEQGRRAATANRLLGRENAKNSVSSFADSKGIQKRGRALFDSFCVLMRDGHCSNAVV